MGVRRVESSLQSQRQVALAPDAGTVVPGRRLPSGGSRFQVLILKIDSKKSPSRSCGNDDEDFCLVLKHLLDVVVMLLGVLLLLCCRPQSSSGQESNRMRLRRSAAQDDESSSTSESSDDDDDDASR